jgi:hypothetical protein
MARRDFHVGATVLWLALTSCRQSQVVENTALEAAPVVVEDEQPFKEHWVDLDIADDGLYSLGCAVDKLGALWCWGHDPTLQARLRPQLGPTELRDRQRSGPSRVEGVDVARAVAVSKDEVCRVDADGRVHCVRDTETNWQVIEGVTAAKQVMVSDLGGCALESDRTLRCWSGSRNAEAVAQDVLDFTMGSSDIGCLLRTDGEALCWEDEDPPESHGRIANAIDIAIESWNSLLVLDAEGRVMVNDIRDGQPEWIERSKLPEAVELDVAPSGPHYNLCGRTAKGTVQCRGRNVYGELGGGHSKGTEETVTMALSADQRALEVAVADSRTCVRTAEEILCVGADASAWAPPVGTVYQHVLDLEAVSLAAHGTTTCALDRAGDLRCWGGGEFHRRPLPGIQGAATPTIRANGRKALLGIYTDIADPDVVYWIVDGRLGAVWVGDPIYADDLRVPESQSEMHAIAGNKYACMIEASDRGRVAVYGDILGFRTRIAGLEGPKAMASSDAEFCAIDRRDRVLCSELTYDEGEPLASVIAGVQNARSIAASAKSGLVTMCAALESGHVMCWVQDRYKPTPATDVGLTDVVSIVGTYSEFCSLDRAGAVACWIPDGDHVEPVPGPTIDAEVVQLVAGYSHTCALDRAGAITCWGREGSGQLGRIPAAVSLQPTPLVFGP